jgi:hypothetical protein
MNHVTFTWFFRITVITNTETQMKNDLTTTQQDFISYMRDAFINLNESNKSVPFNLVDVSKITAEANRIAVGKANLKLHNEGVTALRNELVVKLAKQINEDFARSKVCLEATLNTCHDITFKGYNKKYRGDRDFSLEVRFKERNTEFGSEYTGEFYYAESCIAKEKFDTVEAYLASDTVQKNLLKLFQYVEKDPECQR